MIRLSKSVLDRAEADALSRVILEDGYLGMGKEVKKFEEAVQSFLKTDRTVVCVNTGTAALHLAVEAACPAGSEVLVPALTFVASYQAITAARCVPVPCEIDPGTGLIDLTDAGKRITAKTKAVMPVHYASQPLDMDAVGRFAEKHRLRVIEDAAHAFGCTYNGKPIGSFGDIACFSFDGIKNITCGEGGAVVTADREVARKIQDARLLGVEKDTEKRYTGQRSWEFDVTAQGYRYHMSNLNAAIGLAQLKKAPLFFARRKELAAGYHRGFSSVSSLALLALSSDRIVPHIYPVRVLNGRRDALREYLLKQEIETGIHYFPNHRLTFFGADRYRNAFPLTDRFYSELLTLPLHPDISAEDQAFVIAKVKEGLREVA